MADDAYVAGWLREKLKKTDSEFFNHSGWQAEDMSDAMSFVEMVYDAAGRDMPDKFEDTKLARHLKAKSAANRTTEALAASPGSTLNFVAGMTEKAHKEAYRWWIEALSNGGEPCNLTLAGAMNAGKTNFTLLGVEYWLDMHPNGVIATNMVSLDLADYHVTSMTEFEELFLGSEEFLETNGESGEPPVVPVEKNIIWVFDEASKWCDARTFRTQVAKKYIPAVKKFAKRRIDAIHIIHSGKDIHPELRSDVIVSDFVHKTGRQSAIAYESMDRDSGEFLDKYAELTAIPPTSLEYSPDDFAPWSWN